MPRGNRGLQFESAKLAAQLAWGATLRFF